MSISAMSRDRVLGIAGQMGRRMPRTRMPMTRTRTRKMKMVLARILARHQVLTFPIRDFIAARKRERGLGGGANPDA